MRLPENGRPILNVPKPIGSLIGFTIFVHAALIFLSDGAARMIYSKLVFFPSRMLFDNAFAEDPIAFLLAPIGYALLHADWVHLLVNMAWLLVFGSAVARRMSPVWFILFYCVGSLAGSMTMFAIYGGNGAPIIGASAAVAAISGALISVSLRPRPDRPPPPRPFHIRKTAIGFVVIYIAMNIFFGVVTPELFSATGRIAWEAHLGGFAVGYLIMPFFDGRGLYR